MDGKIDYDELRSATNLLEEIFTYSWAFDYNDWIYEARWNLIWYMDEDGD